jgi:hypothetical protein
MTASRQTPASNNPRAIGFLNNGFRSFPSPLLKKVKAKPVSMTECRWRDRQQAAAHGSFYCIGKVN